MVTLDTVRADRIGCYGRAAAATPRIDGLAARGVRFAHAVAPTPLTLPSHATVLTGLTPLRHGVRSNLFFALAPEAETLAEILRRAGYRTGAAVASVVLAPHHGLDQGFEYYSAPGAREGAESFLPGRRTAAKVNELALGWLDTIGRERFFLWIHYMDAHAPHIAPEAVRARFAKDAYQGQIAAIDAALGELLDAMEGRDRLADTLIVVVADHGEDLGDHGEYTHGIFVYDSTLAVPFVVAGPGVASGRVEDRTVGLVDVSPTILDAVGSERHEAVDGASLWDTLTGHARPAAGRAIYAESMTPRYEFAWSELRALVVDRHKFIAAPRAELYDLDTDPGEARNLIETEPGRARELRSRLRDVMEDATGKVLTGGPATPSAEEREALRSLGYLGGDAAAPAADAALPDPKDRLAAARHVDQAEELIRAGRPVEAERLLRSLLAIDPDSLHLRMSLMVALLYMSPETAETEGRALLAVADQQPEGYRIAASARVLLAQIWMKQGRHAEAATALEQAMVIPQDAGVHVGLAKCYLELGRRADAVRTLRTLADERPLPADAAALLASLAGGK